MLDDEEKQQDPSSTPAEVVLVASPHPRHTPLSSVTTRLKHFFPLVKSRSASPLVAPPKQTHHPPPAIITTSPTSPAPAVRTSGGNASGTERLSSSSLDNAPDSASSARTSTSANGALFMLGSGGSGGNTSQTRLHVVTSGAVAAAVGVGSNRIHFDDTISIRTSDERSGTPSLLALNSRPSLSSVRPAIEGGSSSIGTKEKFLAKVLPAKLRLNRRHRKQNHSVTSLSDHAVLPTTRSAPASPKLSTSPAIPLSTRSSNDMPLLPPLPLPALRPSESLPAIHRPFVPSPQPESPIRSPRRGRSSTVSSINSDNAVPRASQSRTRRTNTIFSGLKKTESGRGTPVEKLSLDDNEEEILALPPSSDSDSGEDYFRRLLSEEGGLHRCIRKLVESPEPIHLSAVAVYLSTIPFSGVPLDMAMRFLLLHLPLPKEQGAIYRLLELFARRYHICNPSLWDSHDQILVVCYSILMLNTDAWNTNNKIKMTREQYVKNTSGQGVSEDILSCWYDNITLTPFIDSTHPTLSKLRTRPTTERPSRPMLDTYTPLLESRLEDLKIIYSTKGKEFAHLLENHLHYTGTLPTLPISQTQSQIETCPKVTLLNRGRAKSEGFALSRLSVLSPLNGETARLVKLGIFPRRERTSRFGRASAWSWAETGVILLDSKIMFVKGDLSPLRHLINTLNESSEDQIIPPLGSEIILELSGSVAFYDTSIPVSSEYALRIVSAFGDSDIIVLPTESDLNEWTAAINYLSATTAAQSPPQDDTASISPALLRRRAGTMAPPAGRPVPLRAVSSTLELRGRSKSEQPTLSTSASSQDKVALYTAFQRELEAKLPLQKMAVDSLLRQARGLLIQTPLQDKSRLAVLSALERVMRRLKGSRIELERGVTYIAILSYLVGVCAESKIRLVDEKEIGAEEFQLPMLGFVNEGMSEENVENLLSGTSLYGSFNASEDGDLGGVPVRRIGTPTKSIPLGKLSPNVSPAAARGTEQRPAPRHTFSSDEVVSARKREGEPSPESKARMLIDPQDLGLEKSESAPASMATGRGIPHSLRAENVSETTRKAEITNIVKEGGS